jgi:SAM-dependent methyltransferase
MNELKYATDYYKIYGSGKKIFYMPANIVGLIKRYLLGNLLDIGTADGEKLKFLIEGCELKEIIGIEPDSVLATRAGKLFKSNKNVKIINDYFENFKWERGYFNTILVLEVIEHLPRRLVRKFLVKIKDLLTEKGIIIISTPNRYIYLTLCMLGLEKRDPTHLNEMHYWDFRKTMRKYFNEKYFVGVLPGMSVVRKCPNLYPIFSKINGLFAYPLVSRAVYFIGSKP